MMTKLEEKLLELGYVKYHKSNYMCKRYVLNFEYTAIEIAIGSPNYPEFNGIYIHLPGILYLKKVLNEINKVYDIAIEHQKILKEFGIEFDYYLGESELCQD